MNSRGMEEEHDDSAARSPPFESGDERLLRAAVEAPVFEEDEKRGCLSRLRPLLCRCLVRARRETTHQVESYGKVERNPLHDTNRQEASHDARRDGGKVIEIVAQQSPPQPPPSTEWRGEEKEQSSSLMMTTREATRQQERPQTSHQLLPTPPQQPKPQQLSPRPQVSSNTTPPPPQEEEEEEEEDNEPEEEYVVGGYHRVRIGDVYDDRYKVLHKLGWGVYSTVWCCYDTEKGEKIALKIQKSAPEYTNAAVNEIKILQHVAKAAKQSGRESDVVQLLEHFYVSGPHGNHVCMAFELLGETLLFAIQEKGVLQVEEVRGIARCLLTCLAFVHEEVGVVHTDIKPENVLLEPKRSGAKFRDRVKLVDLGTAFYLQGQTARDIQTREYRCPEGILGILPYTAAADIWSVGCLLFELLTGETLFDPQSPQPGEVFSKDESHLAQAIELLGKIPTDLTKRATRNAKDWFHGDNTLRNITVAPPQSGIDAVARVLEENFNFPRNESREVASFLHILLQYEPSKRASATQALQHPWLADTELL